jgi:hypothetical protein
MDSAETETRRLPFSFGLAWTTGISATSSSSSSSESSPPLAGALNKAGVTPLASIFDSALELRVEGHRKKIRSDGKQEVRTQVVFECIECLKPPLLGLDTAYTDIRS